MTIIKLDAKAIEVLFPAGSEQRVELQRCVIAEFAKKAWSAKSSIPAGDITTIVDKALSSHVSSINLQLNEAFKKVQTERLVGLGYVSQTNRGYGWSRDVTEIKLTPAIQNMIEAEAKSAVNGVVQSSIKAAIDLSVESKLKSITVQTQISNAVQAALNSEVIKQVQQALLKQGTNNG